MLVHGETRYTFLPRSCVYMRSNKFREERRVILKLPERNHKCVLGAPGINGRRRTDKGAGFMRDLLKDEGLYTCRLHVSDVTSRPSLPSCSLMGPTSTYTHSLSPSYLNIYESHSTRKYYMKINICILQNFHISLGDFAFDYILISSDSDGLSWITSEFYIM